MENKKEENLQHNNTGDNGEDGLSYINPEPPPELKGQILNADNIGETVFSKHWLFSVLMRLIQTVDSDVNKSGEDSEEALNIDEELQDELCKLWDMSMNPEVVKFLQEFNAVDILTGVISKSRAPRATEICVGILGNMACNDVVCMTMSQNEKLRSVLILLVESVDPPTLVELTRLLRVCISCHKANKPWLESLRSNTSVFTQISYILQSSTNGDLLENAGELIDAVMYCDDDVCAQWANPELVLGVLEALKQLGTPSDCLPIFLHILHLVSTCEKGVDALASYGSDIVDLMMKYLTGICEEDMVGIDGKESIISSVLSVINVLLHCWEDRKKFIQEDYQLLRCVLKILHELLPLYSPKEAEKLMLEAAKNSESKLPVPFESYSQDFESDRTTVSSQPQIQPSEPSSSSVNTAPSSTQHDENKASISPAGSLSHSDAESKEETNANIDTESHTNVAVTSASNDSIDECEKEYNQQVFDNLFAAIQSSLTAITNILSEVCFPNGVSDQSSKCLGIPESLEYLNTNCQTIRIYYMAHVLKTSDECEENNCLQLFLLVAKQYNASKVSSVLTQFK